MGFLLFALLALSQIASAADPAVADPQRVQYLHNLLVEDCGSCHGLTMKGGLGPPLLPESLAGKPTAFLVATILDGRPGTPMPPWRPFLSESDATWMVETLERGLTP
jgi:cytochrome c55X